MARHKHQTDPPPALWTLDTLDSWQGPEWTLDTLDQWTTALDGLQAKWDEYAAEIERPFLTWAAEAEAAFADADGTPDKAASFTRDKAERK